MAWVFVGVSNVVAVTGTSHLLVTTGISGTLQAGDLLIACISSRIASTTSVTLPTGGEWTLVGEQKNNNVLTSNLAVPSGLMAYCIRGASNPNLTFTHPVAPSVALGRIVAYRNVDQTSPRGQTSSATTPDSTTAVSVGGLLTAQENELLVAIACGGQEAAWSNFRASNPATGSGATDTTTAPTTGVWIERADSLTTTGADTSLAIFDAVKGSVGSTGLIQTTASIAAGHVLVIAAFKAAALPEGAGLSAGVGAATAGGAATNETVGTAAGVATATGASPIATTDAAGAASGVGAATAVGEAFTGTLDAWNAADKSANITLSNNDKTATLSTAVTGGVRSTKKYLNGTETQKFYVEFFLTNAISGFSCQLGLREVSAALNASAGSTFQCATNSGNILTGSATNIGNIGGAPLLDGDVVCMAWSPSTERGWFRKNGGLWNNDAAANPATNTNGFDISVLNNTDHALFFLAASSLNGASVTVRTELVDLTLTAPSGFVSWMGEALGAATTDGVGNAAGVGTASAVSEATKQTSSVTTAGVGTATAGGAATKETAGTAAGVGAATGSGAATVIVAGDAIAAGIGTAAAVGDVGSAHAAATGAASGIGAASGAGAQTATVAGSASGVGTATAFSSAAAFVSGVGAASGIAAAAATGRQIATVAVAASGASTATATGGKTATASGSASGLGIASGSSSAAAYISGVGAASGIGAATATGFAHSAAAAGTAAGLGAAAATGGKVATTTSAVAAIAAAAAVSGATNAAAGAASGIGAASATGFQAAVVFGEAAGAANAIGTASGTGFGIQPSSTPGERVTELPFVPRSGSVPASMRGAAVAGSRRIAAVAGHDRIAIVPRRDRAA